MFSSTHVMSIDREAAAHWRTALTAARDHDPVGFFAAVALIDSASWEGLRGRLADLGVRMPALEQLLAAA